MSAVLFHFVPTHQSNTRNDVGNTKSETSNGYAKPAEASKFPSAKCNSEKVQQAQLNLRPPTTVHKLFSDRYVGLSLEKEQIYNNILAECDDCRCTMFRFFCFIGKDGQKLPYHSERCWKENSLIGLDEAFLSTSRARRIQRHWQSLVPVT